MCPFIKTVDANQLRTRRTTRHRLDKTCPTCEVEQSLTLSLATLRRARETGNSSRSEQLPWAPS